MADDMRKMILTQLKVPDEYKDFLEGIGTPVVREWCYICMTVRMPLDKIKQLCAAAESNPTATSLAFMEERERYLRDRYENNEELKKQYSDLLHRVQIMYERASAIEEGLNGKLTEAMQEKDKVFGQMIQTKDELIRHYEGQLAEQKKEFLELRNEAHELKKEVSGSKEEVRALIEKNNTMREKIYSLEDQLRTASIRLSSMTGGRDQPGGNAGVPADQGSGQTAGKAEDSASGSFSPIGETVDVLPYGRWGLSPGRLKKRRSLFKKEDRIADEFIRLYIENVDYSEGQKEFLIRCLERGDPIEVIREFASPSLSVKHMEWLRRIIYERMR